MVLSLFRLQISDPTEAEALISKNLICQVTDIVYKVEDPLFWSGNASTAKVLDIRLKIAGLKKNVSSAVRTILTKDDRIKKQENLRVPTARDHMMHHTKGVRNTKKHASRQHVVNNQKTYVCLNSSPKHSRAD